MDDKAIDEQLSPSYINKIAKTCHEVNKAFCECIGDFSQTSWVEAPDWQKESAVNGVNFHLEDPTRTPEDSHINWLKVKEADGWIFGEIKNAEKKTHPCMVPYDQLPNAQQTKDALFVAVIRAMK